MSKHRQPVTKGTFICTQYHNLKGRTEGTTTNRPKIYIGKEYCSLEEYKELIKNSPNFHTLWDNYVANNFKTTLAPSPDRIDSDKGYLVNNILFDTYSNNCRRGAYRSNEIQRVNRLNKNNKNK